MKVELSFISPNAEESCELGARICYDSGDKMTENSKERLLPMLLKSGHMSIFEHSSASFLIEGVSRAATHQLIRHRLASYSQRSQRYVNESNFNYVIPPAIAENEEAVLLYEETIENINKQYLKLVELGIRKEDARFLLPNAASTSLYMTANFREWLHVIDERVSKGAQWEIREMMIIVWKELYKQAPVIFGLEYFKNWGKDFASKQEIFETRIK